MMIDQVTAATCRGKHRVPSFMLRASVGQTWLVTTPVDHRNDGRAGDPRAGLSGFAYGLQLTLTVTQEDRARIQATNLGSWNSRRSAIIRRQQDAPRTIAADSKVTNPHPLPGGVNGQPLRLDGTDFTVVPHCPVATRGTGTSPCDGGSAVTYPSLGVNVRVSWQAQGMTKDVESNTVLTPPKGTLSDVRVSSQPRCKERMATGCLESP